MTIKKSDLLHPCWGRIIVTRNPRARRIIMRALPDAIHVTTPPYATKADIEHALDQCGEELLRRQKENSRATIGKDYSIDTPNFRIRIIEDNCTGIKITGCNGTYTIYSPQGTDYSNENIQQKLRQGIKAAMKHCAATLLPARLEALAQKHGFKYSNCTVRDARSRWGSCSSRRSISLNIHLVVLPDRLIDYVLLHELCHTVEMNHSEKFWALMDRCTAPARSRTLRAELKKEKFLV